jgi:DNA-binding transcriptional ArsR family regulator
VAFVPDADQHRPPSSPLSTAEAEQLAQFMAAFATASRLQLLYALHGVERTVEELAEVTELTASVVSQQLRVLRLLNLVRSRRDGRHMRYRLFDGHVADLLSAIRHHAEHAARGEPDGAEQVPSPSAAVRG